MHLPVNTSNVNRPKDLFCLFVLWWKLFPQGQSLSELDILASCQSHCHWLCSLCPPQRGSWPLSCVPCCKTESAGRKGEYFPTHNSIFYSPSLAPWTRSWAPVQFWVAPPYRPVAGVGVGGWGRQGLALPPFLLPLLLFVALNLLGFFFAEEFESIMPTRESIIHARDLTYDLRWEETVF